MSTPLITRVIERAEPQVYQSLKVAYMMSRFPKLTETFILTEMMAMQELGVTVEVYPLQREKTKVVHPDALPFVQRAHFTSWLSFPLLLAHLYFLLNKPGAYFHTIWMLLRANWGSVWYLGGAVLFFPKAVYLSRLMQQHKIEHLHAHFASHPAMVAWVIHQLTGIPWSFTAHGSDLHKDQHMLAEKVRDAKVAVTISNYNRKFILDHVGLPADEKIAVVHCGVDMNDYQPRTTPTAWDQRKGPFRILCIGTLHEVKGQRYLLEACAGLNRFGLNFECHLAGDGEDRSILETIVRSLDLQGRVIFHGRQTREQVRELLRQADVLVAPSAQTACGRREGIPVVLMEALACGVPAIGSDLSGIPEILIHNQTGLLTPQRDASAIAEALMELAENRELRQHLAIAGRDKVEREFNLHANALLLSQQFQSEDEL